MEFTVVVYKKDSRCKTGEKVFEKLDFMVDNEQDRTVLENRVKVKYPEPKFRTEIHKTWVTRRNAMTGQEFVERFDTPYYCSPSSDTYWSS